MSSLCIPSTKMCASSLKITTWREHYNCQIFCSMYNIMQLSNIFLVYTLLLHHLNSLFLLQKKILRIMTFSPYLAHTDPLFKSLEILPIDNIFIERIGITMFKVTYELILNRSTNYFQKTKTSTLIIPEIKIY